MQSLSSRGVVLVATGGTIAGVAAQPQDHVGYTAGALAVDALVAAVPALQGHLLETVTLANLDSCDMDHATWLALGRCVTDQLARPEVTGVVITHGTDTLEETAYFLHRTVAADKPVVLTAAMRPATALSADGPQNLFDAVAVAQAPAARGVLVVLGGRVFAGMDVRKVHGYRIDAFDAGDAGPVAVIEAGVPRCFRAWPVPADLQAGVLELDPGDIVTSHAGARGAVIDALVAAGAKGIVIAGTGNGSVHAGLLAAARRAQGQGVVVWRTSRCLLGGVVGQPADSLPSAGALTPAQARVALLLDLLRR
jgi:L-asparaginase